MGGVPVEDILLDTGSAKTLIMKKLVAPESMVEGEVSLQEVHYCAEIQISFEENTYTAQAAVSERLPVSLLLG